MKQTDVKERANEGRRVRGRKGEARLERTRPCPCFKGRNEQSGGNKLVDGWWATLPHLALSFPFSLPSPQGQGGPTTDSMWFWVGALGWSERAVQTSQCDAGITLRPRRLSSAVWPRCWLGRVAGCRSACLGKRLTWAILITKSHDPGDTILPSWSRCVT